MSFTATENPPPQRHSAARLTDFGDWLSPMLVKELRQGLRARVFVIAFILLQAVLSLVLLFSLDGNSESSHYSFWSVAAVLIVGVMPLRGFAALSDEIDHGTLDLLVVTKLSSIKIAFGKWCALIAQTLLLCVTILPYVVMRYFLGGINLPIELAIFVHFFLLSCVLTALTVSFSVFRSYLLKSAVVLTAGAGAFMLVQSFLDYGSGIRRAFGYDTTALVVFLSAYCCWFLLEFGASRIAPAAENHSTRKRLVTLAVAIVLASLSSWVWVRAAAIVLAIVPIVDALSESNPTNPAVLGPFVRLGFPGRLAGRLLYPGWSSGVWFTLILSIILVAADYSTIDSSATSGQTWVDLLEFGLLEWLAWPAAVLFPVPLLWILFRKLENRFGIFMLIQIGTSALAFCILLVSASIKHSTLAIPGLVFPHGVLAAVLGEKHPALEALLPRPGVDIAATVTAIILIASMVVSLLGFRDLRTAEKAMEHSE